MIDVHCHLLPGIDDGPATLDESVALARAAVAAGTRMLVATPHVSDRYPNNADAIATLVAELRGRLREEQIALRVGAGAEIAMSRVAETHPSELRRLTLGGSRCLLIEPPFAPVLAGAEVVVEHLHDLGYRVLLAHPERCPALRRDRAMLERLVSRGVLTSITAASLQGRFGETVRRFSLELVRDGLVHNVASDAHDALGRPPTVTAELESAGLRELADWLTQAVPRAILADSEIPPRPAVELPPMQRAAWRSWVRRGSDT